jgi:hypothetical protein
VSRPVKSAEARTKMLAVRIPPHLYERVAAYAERFGISLTDATILALYRGFGDQRGIVLHEMRGHFGKDGSFAAPRRAQSPAKADPLEPMPDPFDEATGS